MCNGPSSGRMAQHNGVATEILEIEMGEQLSVVVVWLVSLWYHLQIEIGSCLLYDKPD